MTNQKTKIKTTPWAKVPSDWNAMHPVFYAVMRGIEQAAKPLIKEQLGECGYRRFTTGYGVLITGTEQLEANADNWVRCRPCIADGRAIDMAAATAAVVKTTIKDWNDNLQFCAEVDRELEAQGVA